MSLRKLTKEKLTCPQWYELDEQFSYTPGEDMKLRALLNRFGYHPMTNQQALKLAMTLLDFG
jgi:hypothetical protein